MRGSHPALPCTVRRLAMGDAVSSSTAHPSRSSHRFDVETPRAGDGLIGVCRERWVMPHVWMTKRSCHVMILGAEGDFGMIMGLNSFDGRTRGRREQAELRALLKRSQRFIRQKQQLQRRAR